MSEKLFLKKVGRTIRLHRLEKALTQEELGGRANICYKYLGEVERGRANPSLAIIFRIAKALDSDVYKVLSISSDSAVKELYAYKILGLLKDKEAPILLCLLRVMETFINLMDSLNYGEKHQTPE